MVRVVRLTDASIRGDLMSWTALVSRNGNVTPRRVHFYAQDWEFLIGRDSLGSATAKLQRAVERRAATTTDRSFRVDLADLDG